MLQDADTKKFEELFGEDLSTVSINRQRTFDPYAALKKQKEEKEMQNEIRIMVEKRINILMNALVCYVC